MCYGGLLMHVNQELSLLKLLKQKLARVLRFVTTLPQNKGLLYFATIGSDFVAKMCTLRWLPEILYKQEQTV